VLSISNLFILTWCTISEIPWSKKCQKGDGFILVEELHNSCSSKKVPSLLISQASNAKKVFCLLQHYRADIASLIGYPDLIGETFKVLHGNNIEAHRNLPL
jgi:hypothetical protein